MDENTPVTREWLEQMKDLTSLGHLYRSLANDPAIDVLVEVVNMDLEEVGLAFFNDDPTPLEQWMLDDEILLFQKPGDQMNQAAVYCLRAEPFYIFKRTGKAYV